MFPCRNKKDFLIPHLYIVFNSTYVYKKQTEIYIIDGNLLYFVSEQMFYKTFVFCEKLIRFSGLFS